MSIEERKFKAGLMLAAPQATPYLSVPTDCPVGAGKIHQIEIYEKDFLWAFTCESQGLQEEIKLDPMASRILDAINNRLGLPRHHRYEVTFSDCHFEDAQGMVVLAGHYTNGVSDYYLPGSNLGMARVGPYTKLWYPDGPPKNIHLKFKQLEVCKDLQVSQPQSDSAP